MVSGQQDVALHKGEQMSFVSLFTLAAILMHLLQLNIFTILRSPKQTFIFLELILFHRLLLLSLIANKGVVKSSRT